MTNPSPSPSEGLKDDKPNCMICGRSYWLHMEVSGVGRVCPVSVSAVTYRAPPALRPTPDLTDVEELVERVAPTLCEARGEEPDGSQVRFVDGEMHSATFLEIAKRDARVVIDTIIALKEKM